ncbi:MAG: lipopolysaccharide biosynthesis protein [Bacteroidia bacterium 44-10]|nr:MAG: lipopolysaccharide biosynthesis protein [Bacteroidia bacterium 44-10]
MSLKQKTISGLSWSFIDQIGNLGISFVVGVILARLLSPREFGLIGMITIFTAISEKFINSGFSSALIRKQNCTDIDYSTVFYFNLVIGFLFFGILYAFAPAIAIFFDEPELLPIVRVMALVLIIDSVTIIQRTILTKRIDFKLQTRISIIASIGSGVIAIVMAFQGYGVWSLVIQRLTKQAFNSLFLWIWNKWIPILFFSWNSFKELFGFGSKLLISGLIATLNQNIFYAIIGKLFSVEALGYYTKANEFKNLPSQGLNGIIDRVSFPVLSSIQDEKKRLKQNYQRLIRSTMFITFILMLGMAAVAEPLIITFIGEKWRPSVILLQMLCFVGMMYPLQALNLNMLKVSGRSDLFLKLEIIKAFLVIPTVVLGVLWGIEAMIIGLIIQSLIGYFLNSYWSGNFVGYSTKEQILDILPSFLLAFSMFVAVYMLGLIIPLAYVWKLIIQILFGGLFIFAVGELFKLRDYLFIKSLAIEQMANLKSRNER